MPLPMPRFQLRPNARLCLSLIAVFVVALTLHGTLSRPSLDRYGDMYENFAWGVLWQWGYYKHPPFFAWETAAWFKLFPRTDFFYFLLSGVNAGVALVALWRIAARFGGTGFQVLALALAMVMPPISFLGLNFNANSAMTPIWALLFLFYLRGLERGRLTDAAIIGLLAAMAMLTKYHSLVMLGALLIHAATDAVARRRLLSAFGGVALVVFLLAFSPHLYWLYTNDFRPITYAAHQDDGGGPNLPDSALFLVTPIGYSALALLIARCMRNVRDEYPLILLSGLRALATRVEGRALASFALWPLLLTIALGYVANAELSAVWGIPFYTAYAVIIALMVPPVYYELHLRRAVTAILVFCAILVAVAPVWYRFELKVDSAYYNAPLPEIAAEVDRRWLSAGGGPGGVLLGLGAPSNAVSFYSALDLITLEANSFDVSKAYLSPEQAMKRGLIGLCLKGSTVCVEDMKATMPAIVQPQTFSVAGRDGKAWAFEIWLSPPGP